MIRTKLDNASEVEKLLPLLRLTRKMFIIFIFSCFCSLHFFLFACSPPLSMDLDLQNAELGKICSGSLPSLPCGDPILDLVATLNFPVSSHFCIFRPFCRI